MGSRCCSFCTVCCPASFLHPFLFADHLLTRPPDVLAPLPSLPPFPSHLWGSLPPSPPAGRSQDASFAVLYSDIGREFYKNCTQGEGESARLGWVEGGSVGRFWVLNPEENGKEKEGTEWLERKGVKAFEEDMSQRMLKRFREGGGPGDRGRTRVAFLPTG